MSRRQVARRILVKYTAGACRDTYSPWFWATQRPGIDSANSRQFRGPSCEKMFCDVDRHDRLGVQSPVIVTRPLVAAM
jgi:hypothetical protein